MALLGNITTSQHHDTTTPRSHTDRLRRSFSNPHLPASHTAWALTTFQPWNMHRGSLVPSGKRARFWKFMIGYRQPGPNQVSFLRAILLNTADFPWVWCRPASPALPGRGWRQQTFPSIANGPHPILSRPTHLSAARATNKQTRHGLATTIETDSLRSRHRLRRRYCFALPVPSFPQFSVG